MKIVMRLLILMFIVSISLSLYLVNPFNAVVEATSCSVGWNQCRGPNGERTSSPGDRSGCSVESAGTLEGNGGSVGVYIYTCRGQKTTCFYVFKCPIEDQNPEPEQPPQN